MSVSKAAALSTMQRGAGAAECAWGACSHVFGEALETAEGCLSAPLGNCDGTMPRENLLLHGLADHLYLYHTPMLTHCTPYTDTSLRHTVVCAAGPQGFKTLLTDSEDASFLFNALLDAVVDHTLPVVQVWTANKGSGCCSTSFVFPRRLNIARFYPVVLIHATAPHLILMSVQHILIAC